MSDIINNRKFMHCPAFKGIMAASDQSKGIKNPPLSKAAGGDTVVLDSFLEPEAAYARLLDIRRSERDYAEAPITQAQLGFILWSTQGIQCCRGEGRVATLRPVPSGGARHPFECYIAVRDVTGLTSGLYRYAPLEDMGEKRVTLEYMGAIEDYAGTITKMLAGQAWAAKASVVLFYSCVPYRGEWRYVEASHRVMLIDLGHVGQNAMLSAAALGMGSCCFAAFGSARCDEVLGTDGDSEYTVYAISAGFAKDEE
jgi:SagB-type dehydrogenase family enzyme